MNRTERRKNKLKKEAIYNLNQSQIDNLKSSATSEAIKFASYQFMYLSLMILRDKYGFGKKRLGDFVESVVELMDSVQKDYLTLDDMKNAIYDETGVTLEEVAKGVKRKCKN